MMAEIQDRHRKAASSWAYRDIANRNSEDEAVYAQALADQEAEIADALDAESLRLAKLGWAEPSASAGITAQLVRSGEWRRP